MNVILINDAAYIAQASAIAFKSHSRLLTRYTWMPEKKVEEFFPRIEWMTREGRVYGLEDGGTLRAFIGWFKLDNFRNLGPGALTPDWCSGIAQTLHATGARPEDDVSRLMCPLVRRMMTDLKEAKIPIHAIGITSENGELLNELSMLSYGRIVLDAARPALELMAELAFLPGDSSLPEHSSLIVAENPQAIKTPTIRVRPATHADAKALAALDECLARHIGEPPVLMPDTHGSTVSEWEEWLADPDTVTFIAEAAEGLKRKPVGFIKADPPHFDVSWFVNDPATLSICGLYVEAAERGKNIGSDLLRALVGEGISRGYALISVDCETHNPEARSFWLSRFKPITWSFERRL